jgi:hypothetical protein
MTEITDDYMKQMISRTKEYCIVILKLRPDWTGIEKEKIIWEHGRRNFALRAEGLLSIVCPVTDDSEVRGIVIFNADIGRVRSIMNEDPGVKEGIFSYELHTCRSFPGDSLP